MITNETRSKILAQDVLICDKLWSSMRGLMFRKELQKNQGLLIDLHKDTNAGIHMFFVNFPIDVIWLNSEKLVVATAEDVKPFTLKNPKKFARYIIELPHGVLKAKPVSFGDRFTFGLD